MKHANIGKRRPVPTPKRTKKSNFWENLKSQKWITLICLPICLIATFQAIYWIWGLLFIYWGVSAVINGQAFLLEPIERQRDPALFWLINLLWIGSGITYVLADFPPLSSWFLT
jgi:hypothetical protein